LSCRGRAILRNLRNWHEKHFDTGTTKEINAIGETVLASVNDTTDASLDDQLGALDARTIGDVESGTVARVVTLGDLGDSVGFGVEHIGLGTIVLGLAVILEACGRTIVAIADDHLVLDEQTAHLATLAIRVFGPNGGHAEITAVENFLFC